jgi:hypothetical protein
MYELRKCIKSLKYFMRHDEFLNREVVIFLNVLVAFEKSSGTI